MRELAGRPAMFMLPQKAQAHGRLLISQREASILRWGMLVGGPGAILLTGLWLLRRRKRMSREA